MSAPCRSPPVRYRINVCELERRAHTQIACAGTAAHSLTNEMRSLRGPLCSFVSSVLRFSDFNTEDTEYTEKNRSDRGAVGCKRGSSRGNPTEAIAPL